MKCVRLVGQGVPYRFTDAKARQIVEKDGDGEYCPKSFFKDWNKRYDRTVEQSTEKKA